MCLLIELFSQVSDMAHGPLVKLYVYILEKYLTEKFNLFDTFNRFQHP